MNRKHQLHKSRDSWKSKTAAISAEARQLRKDKKRLTKERDRYKELARCATAQLNKERELMNVAPAPATREGRIFLALRLYRDAGLGFRAVARALDVFSDVFGFDTRACAQTIINWVFRLAIVRIHNYAPPASGPSGHALFTNGTVWLIDISIALSSGKILGLLALNLRYHEDNDEAPTLDDFQAVAVSVAESWTGQSEADLLERIIAVTGRPAALLKDGGADLDKSRRDLAAKGIHIPAIDDVSHVVANLLKHEYEAHASYQPFMTACGKTAKMLKQTILGFLAPPKISMKARFMNLHRLVRWAEQILKHSPPGRAAVGSHMEKLRRAVNELPEHKLFINNFLRDANPLLKCMEILKKKGLSHETWAQCLKLIEPIPPTSPVRKGFIEWGERMMAVAKDLGVENVGLPVSSDGIECFFSVGKRHGTGEIKDPNRIAARLPVECGSITREDAKRVIDVTVREQNEVMDKLPSLLRQRRRILPNPGALSELTLDPGQHLELIPQAKSREKNQNMTDISGRCVKVACPMKGPLKKNVIILDVATCASPMAG